MRISVIIPTYNYGRYLQRALHSVLAQKSPADEIIVVDDGSTDDTRQIMDEFTKHHPMVQYVVQENQGAAAARNQGIAQATGDYLLFLDADDELLEDALSSFRIFQQRMPQVEVIFAGHVTVEYDGRERVHPFSALQSAPSQNFIGYLRKRFSPNNGATLFHQRVFETLRYPTSIRSGEDIPVFAHALARFHCQSFAKPVLRVYKHADSLRNQADLHQSVGLSLVDIVFDPQRLPPALMGFRKEYYARRCLSLFRSLYASGQYQQARSFYQRAVCAVPKSLLLGTYLKKYLKSWCHGN